MQIDAEPAGPIRADEGVVGDQPHTEGEGPLRHEGADPAQPDDPERLAVELDTLEPDPVPDPSEGWHPPVEGGAPGRAAAPWCARRRRSRWLRVR